jgi:RecB family exonuclease
MPKTKVSFSALETFNQCPRKYYYNYILALPRKDWPWLIFGNFVHSVLEKFHKYIIYYNKRNKEIKYGFLMRRAFDSAVRRQDRINKPISEQTQEEAKEMLRVYLDDVKKRCPDVLFVEKWFEIEIGDFLLRGAMDRVDRTEKEDEFAIVDYKTSKKAFDVNKNHQLSLYSYALRRILAGQNIAAKSISKTLNFVRLKKIKSAPHDEQKIQDAVDYVNEVGNKIVNNITTCKTEGEWKPIDNTFCRFCDFKDRCYKSRGMS